MLDYKAAQEDGYSFGFFTTGQVVFVLVVLATNLKIFTFAYSYSIFMIVIITLSVAAAFITWAVLGAVDSNILEHSFSRAFHSLQFYCLVFIIVGLVICDWTVTKLYGT